MKKLIIVLLVFASVFTACDSAKPGGGKLSEGKIVYKLDLGKTEMDFLQKQLFESAKLTIAFKDALMKTEFDMTMVGTTIIADANTKTGLMLMSIMGNKTAARMTAKEFEEKDKGKYTVEYLDETKEIAGYKCKKAVIKLENGGSLSLFYTDDIQPAKLNTDFTYEGVNGFPLEMQVDMNGMVITMMASKVDGSPLPADYFNMQIPEGYTETDINSFGKFGTEGSESSF